MRKPCLRASGKKPLRQIHDHVARKLGPQRFRIWIRNSTQFTLANGHLRIDVPNPFVGRWIENNFQDAITDAVFEVTRRKVQVAYSVDASLATRLRKSQLDSHCSTRRTGLYSATPCSRSRTRNSLKIFGPA